MYQFRVIRHERTHCTKLHTCSYFFLYIVSGIRFIEELIQVRKSCMARSQYPEGSATRHLDTVFSWFPWV